VILACVAGAERGGEGEREKCESGGEKGREPLPSLSNPLPFSLLPYSLPVSTPATRLSDFFELTLDKRTLASHSFNLDVKNARFNPYKYSFFIRIVK